MNNYVWYASYGSNLSADRFLCYIKGGCPEGTTFVEKGCRCKNLPIKISNIEINLPLYFTRYSKRWDGGPAFIGLSSVKDNKTLGRMYLISEEQFIDVVRQENNNDFLQINLLDVEKNGNAFIEGADWYNNILHIGYKDNFPIFTFTSLNEMHETTFTRPSESYLKVICKGYKESYNMKDIDILNYLINKPGIKENYTISEILNLLKNIT